MTRSACVRNAKEPSHETGLGHLQARIRRLLRDAARLRLHRHLSSGDGSFHVLRWPFLRQWLGRTNRFLRLPSLALSLPPSRRRHAPLSLKAPPCSGPPSLPPPSPPFVAL